MRYLKLWVFTAAIAFFLAALLAIKNEFSVIMAAGALGAVAVSIIFVLVLVTVKLAKNANIQSDLDSSQVYLRRSLNGFDAEGKLMIHSWLWRGGR
jgi:hypothetical protein